MESFSKLSPTQFENLTYDLLQASGMQGLVWRTPGSDVGRDIEGTYSVIDFSGHHQIQRWYVECKLYSSSIDWPTIWKKISYADSHGADFLLIVTNNNPSPQCESEITTWNAKDRRIAVRVWRGYQIEKILSSYPTVAAKHGLLSISASLQIGVQSLMFEMMKLAQASYTGFQVGSNIERPLEASSALSELISMRLDEVRIYGRFVRNSLCAAPPYFSWLSWKGEFGIWEETGLRAFLCVLRHLSCSNKLEVVGQQNEARIAYQDARFNLSEITPKLLSEVALWANIELVDIGGNSIEIVPAKV